ncbi:3-isopropylmalate dehydratase small subunit [Labedaea rhizosphaerae]|uniref:3-isopropylmalate dehydratase small subunit n=1 Tax=Labedaea rhizosphaerae TaxID=598644 RepID=A0A4R6SHZ2_LABRH|nr:3-isopropylmalate dehydratase small subunit [Labedaea rhizosphaerae]TDQ00489.1 3-isopropylmalate dehydratase small subunit [Labedaea rhizosphaerae]
MPVQLTAHTGRVVPLRRSDVDTDQIIPAEFCKELTKTGYAKGLFAHWRARGGFVLDDPARAGASILVAGRNFGTGSSREHAVWALRDWGFAAVVAVDYGDIFLRNALKNGLLAVALDEGSVAELADRAEADPAFELTVDLEGREVRAPGFRRSFRIDDRARWLLLNGLDDIAVTLGRDDRIRAYEQARPDWLPVVGR